MLGDLFEITGEHLDRLVYFSTLFALQCSDSRGV